MAVKELNSKEQHYADTREEAEEIVEEAKDDVYLTSFKISEKHNKYGTYFLVDLAFSYDTPREIMESAAARKEVEEHGEHHEGLEYSVNPDGTTKVVPGQLAMDELNEDEGDEE
ncbi:organic solvent tolerance protein OstA [Bacillus thuringiensis]|uniref:organic solvent tolerance protein OstA n=1 Tax=Bacillus thuringiensis TaxID=1428 RepID=UPI000A37A51A|nr:organic solvent tolerance protein OstA [Bacillus thuringiensis]MBG9753355.1 organic solvent tolerance protein OstA [Bacillus thuringiensis]MBG9777443.1 organic solvent tolerance protein OstA [Bacillus thuringiensis]MBG9926689.1 organic solvent tolerance protein OstA [Bacillus thuringiensis]OTZ87343.1 organic solvent tolerance protein OstA [Bacillus thuringiensis serovar ostriniae]